MYAWMYIRSSSTYDSDAESEGSNNDQEFYGNGDVGVVSPGPG